MSKRYRVKNTGTASFIGLTCLFFLLLNKTSAQSAAEDSLLYTRSVYNAVKLFHQAAGRQAGIYNGSQYAKFPFNFEEDGFPFFKDPNPGKGSVVYDGILYENLQLQFDEIQEVVIMEDSARRIQLLNPRIAMFTLFDNTFIRIVRDSTNKILAEGSFYNVLYKGNNTLLKREEKKIREDVSKGFIQRYVDASEFYYLQKDNVWYSIKTKGAILTVFKDRKKELRQFIRKNDLSYKKDRDNMLIRVTAYYEQLTK